MNVVSRSTARLKAALLAVMALALLTSVSFLTPPQADAQVLVYSGDFVKAAGEACPVGSAPSGAITNAALPGWNVEFCRSIGLAPIVGIDECRIASNFFGISNGGYGYSPSTGLCGFTGYAHDAALACQAPSIRTNDLVSSLSGNPIVFDGCILPILLGAPAVPPPPFPPTSFMASFAATTECIDSDVVQNDPAAAGLGLGETFVGQDGNRFSITTGGPTCTFDGSDCDSALNLLQVDDVGKCLAARATATAAAATESVPAAPAAAPVAIAVGELAHTGTGDVTSVVGILGASLLGAGVMVNAGMRRRNNDS